MIAQTHALPAASDAAIARSPHPLAVVLGWELRRLRVSRSGWIVAGVAFVVFFLLEWAIGEASAYSIPSPHGTRTFLFAWASVYGLFNTLPQAPGMYLALFLPFVSADGVARDLKRRTHELLMTTAIPSWAYVWGRYLFGLLLSLSMACLMLLAIISAIFARHVSQPTVYPAPAVSGIVALWALIVLPPTVLLSSLSFALGTLLPRLATVIKVTLMLGWFIAAQFLARFAASMGEPGKFGAWDPTSLSLAYAQTTSASLQHLATQTQSLSDQAFQAALQAFEQQLPDIRAWIFPHLTWIVLGFGMVALITPMFQRFRNVMR